jgi:LysM repeat protein
VQSHDWRRYAAPAAFLAAVTVAVVLIRAGLESGGSNTTSAGTTTVLVKRYYRVHAGDTFAVIAHKTGVSVKTIQRLNPRVKATSLHIGERLRIQ